MDRDFLRDRIAVLKTQIVEYETVITNVNTGVIFSYTLDTGQTRQTVTRQNISV